MLDKHAPERRNVLTIRPNVEFYTDVVYRARKEMKCEKKSRATRFDIHKEIFSAVKLLIPKSSMLCCKEIFHLLTTLTIRNIP